MIKSRFSKLIAPLAITTAISGGMLVKTAVTEKVEEKTEQTTTNPMENPAVLGTVFTLGLLGTAGSAALGRAVDLRYKNSREQIEDIFDVATLEEKDYQEAFEEECQELDRKGVEYDKEELRKQKYTPLTKEQVRKYINTRKAQIRRVTENVMYDEKAEQQLRYLIEEVKSAVKYDKKVDEDIKVRMLYFLDKATTPKKDFSSKDKSYRIEHPETDFDKRNGIPLQSRTIHYMQEAIFNNTYDIAAAPEIVLINLTKIKQEITQQPEILNKYDREECLNLINASLKGFETTGKFDNKTYKQILHIYVLRQQTY